MEMIKNIKPYMIVLLEVVKKNVKIQIKKKLNIRNYFNIKM